MALSLRKITVCFLFIFLVQVPATLVGFNVKHCNIKDAAKHEYNQKLLRTLIEKELAAQDESMTPVDQAHYLSAKIKKIAHSLLEHGFSTDAYGIPDFDQNSMISFYAFSLWEGEHNRTGPIPVTFFIYIWPSEKLALKYNSSNPLNRYYASSIHSHPIPCSFAVLQGTLTQNNYECVKSHPTKIARFVDEEIFKEGQGDIDDLTKPFIHQLYNKDPDSTVCLSLHAYGLSSEDKVMKCFRETRSNCTYTEYLRNSNL